MLTAGEKVPRHGQNDTSFHLVERGFGHFACTVWLSGAFEPSKSHASLAHGKPRVKDPKIAERRGRPIRIPVAAARDTQRQ